MEKTKTKRETFSSGLAVFFATLGSAVGLGNIWKFPYIAGENGGGAFVLVYLICVVLIGLPVMVAEFFIGRKSRRNAIGAFEVLNAKPRWKLIGYMGVAAAALILFFYSSVAGWVYSYVFKSLRGDFAQLSQLTTDQAAQAVGAQFDATMTGAVSPMIWQLIVILLVSMVLLAGVKNGIERMTKTLMPVLFVLIIICDVQALMLRGAKEGMQFLFNVDFSKLTAPVILSALGLAFFKLSVGMGTMITYGSYFTQENDMIGTSVRVALSDTMISLLAGIAIFPVVFTFGMEPSSGPGLLFETIPLVFSRIPFGNLLLIAFFILTSIAATTAMLSMMEVPIAFLCEEKGMKRSRAVLLTSGFIVLVGILTVHPESLFGSVAIAGMNFFDLFDFISSKVLLPVGGLLIALFAGYVIKADEYRKELTNNGTLKNGIFVKIVLFLTRYVAPVLLVLVFLNTLGIIEF